MRPQEADEALPQLLATAAQAESRATTTSRQIAHSRNQRFNHGEFSRNGEQWHKCHYGQVLDIRFLTSEGTFKACARSAWRPCGSTQRPIQPAYSQDFCTNPDPARFTPQNRFLTLAASE